ncbi:MAG TPA: SHD1 domain-containing protein, partial [Pirellulales bacterium]|nr:SHD1 domain-containing protein [Pirellulales bacterium]
KTEPNAKGVSLATMTGNGDLEFDKKAGLFRSLDMKYSIVVTHSNVSITVPVSLTYRYVPEEEMAKREEKARLASIEARKQAEIQAAKAKKEAEARAEAARPKPLTAETRAAALKDLKSADIGVAKEAAKRLAHALPGENRDEISAALVHAMKGADDWADAEFLGALDVWGTDNCERAVIFCSKSGTWFVRDKAIDILGKKFTNQAAIDALAAQFHNNHGAAAAALKKIKSPAVEEAVLPFIKDVDFWLRNDAIGVLQEVGGQKSLRALKHELTKTWAHGNPLETGPFNGAISAIERRLPDDDAAAEKSDEPKMRTWQDASGKFDVDAVLIGVKDEKVTLKKKDGKQITLPVSKLSDEDQEYLKTQSKPKEVNPFE